MNKSTDNIGSKEALEAISNGVIGLKEVISLTHHKLESTILSEVSVNDFPFIEKMRKNNDCADENRLNHIDIYLNAVGEAKEKGLSIGEIIDINGIQYLLLEDNQLYIVAETSGKVMIVHHPLKREYKVVANNPSGKILMQSLKMVTRTTIPNYYSVLFNSASYLTKEKCSFKGGWHHEAFFYADEKGNFIKVSNIGIKFTQLSQHGSTFYYQGESTDFHENSLYLFKNDKSLEIKHFRGRAYPIVTSSGKNIILIIKPSNSSIYTESFTLIDADNLHILIDNADKINMKFQKLDINTNEYKTIDQEVDWTGLLKRNNLNLRQDKNIPWSYDRIFQDFLAESEVTFTKTYSDPQFRLLGKVSQKQTIDLSFPKVSQTHTIDL
ncbi:MAG: hypothetical protein V3575_03135 [Candidatus Absconditabacteria bacterium]